MASGAAATESCEDASTDYTGPISISCLAGVLDVTAEGCLAKCLTGDTVDTTIGGQTQTITLSSDLTDAQGTTFNCQNLSTGYSGFVQVDCEDGVLSVSS
eukprot:4907645-Amphidinium_carterae.1